VSKLLNQKGVIFNIPNDLLYLMNEISDKFKHNRSKFKSISVI